MPSGSTEAVADVSDIGPHGWVVRYGAIGKPSFMLSALACLRVPAVGWAPRGQGATVRPGPDHWRRFFCQMATMINPYATTRVP